MKRTKTKRFSLALCCVALMTSIGVATAASNIANKKPLNHIQHYEDFGPFCISTSTGVMRAPRTGQKCLPGERRIAHKRIPLDAGPKGDKGAKGAAGVPGVAGPQGVAGATGATGAPGPAGPAGKDGQGGAQGAKGDTGATGATGERGPAGPKGEQGATGSRGETGSTGATGAKGEAGPTGPTGPEGKPGKDGESGLGNGTGYLCISNGNNVKWGGDDGSLCDPGHDLLVQIVVVK